MKYTKNIRLFIKLLLIGLFIIFLFTGIFYLFDHTHFNGIHSEHEEQKLFHRLYFTVTTLSSAGYGDITPKSITVKSIVILLQLLLIISLMSGLINILQ